MRLIELQPGRILSDEEADGLAGAFLDESHYDTVIDRDTRVVRPDGSPLLVFRRGAVPTDLCALAYPAIRRVHLDGDNRGLASGLKHRAPDLDETTVGIEKPTRFYLRRRDGRISNTHHALGGRGQPTSGVIGYFDRVARYPYCRTTAFNLDHPDLFARCLPLFRHVDGVFAAEAPDRHAAQMARIRETHPDFVIHGTAFTTVTVNKNFRTACHKDKGDLPEGFGVMTVLQAGHYAGGLLVFPKYRVAVDVRSGGVLLSDVHSWHGNTAIHGAGAFERWSLVLYYRRLMQKCGSAAEERERAKRRRRGDPLNA